MSICDPPVHVVLVHEAVPDGGFALTSDSDTLEEVRLVTSYLNNAPGILSVAAESVYDIYGITNILQKHTAGRGPLEVVFFNMLENHPLCDALPLACATLGLPLTSGTHVAYRKDEMKAMLRANEVRVPAGGIVPVDTVDLHSEVQACLRHLLRELSYYESMGELTPASFGPLTVIAKNVATDASEGITQSNVIELKPTPDGQTYESSKLEELVAHLQQSFKQPVIVEQFIDGREFNLSILEEWKQDPANPDRLVRIPRLMPFAEIEARYTPEQRARGLRLVVTYESKWSAWSNVPI